MFGKSVFCFYFCKKNYCAIDSSTNPQNCHWIWNKYRERKGTKKKKRIQTHTCVTARVCLEVARINIGYTRTSTHTQLHTRTEFACMWKSAHLTVKRTYPASSMAYAMCVRACEWETHCECDGITDCRHFFEWIELESGRGLENQFHLFVAQQPTLHLTHF